MSTRCSSGSKKRLTSYGSEGTDPSPLSWISKDIAGDSRGAAFGTDSWITISPTHGKQALRNPYLSVSYVPLGRAQNDSAERRLGTARGPLRTACPSASFL